jgi:spoIIIJ-associated protein
MAEVAGSVETVGADVETAVAEGLAILGVERDEVEIEVLEEPSRGVFGLGAREARVRVTVRPTPASAADVEGVRDVAEAAEDVPAEGEEDASAEGEEGEIARGTVLELLELMGVEDARVETRRAEADREGELAPLVLDVTAPHDDLVGPNGETLYALQRITRLIVGREQGSRTHLVVDVNGFRSRRQQSLRRLARRLAKQAVATDRTVVLEPMPPNERRIIHIALRDHPGVRTESIGEGDRRKVTIIPR